MRKLCVVAFALSRVHANSNIQTTDPHRQLILYKILLSYGRNKPNFLRAHKKWQPLIPLLMDHVLVDFDPEAEDNFVGSVSSSGWSRAAVVPIEARLRLLAIGILYEVCRVQKFTITDLSEYFSVPLGLMYARNAGADPWF